MNGIYVRSYESFDKALRRFSKLCDKAGVLYELKRKQSYEKPSEERKRKKDAAKNRLIKDKRFEVLNYEDRKRNKKF